MTINNNKNNTEELKRIEAELVVPEANHMIPIDVKVIDGITKEQLEEMFKDIHQKVIEDIGIPSHISIDSMPLISQSNISEEDKAKYKVLTEQLSLMAKLHEDNKDKSSVEMTEQKPRHIDSLNMGQSDKLLMQSLSFCTDRIKISEAKNAKPSVSKPDIRGNVIPDMTQIIVNGEDKEIKPPNFDQRLMHFINARKAYKDNVKNGENVTEDSLKKMANKTHGDSIPDYDEMQLENDLTMRSRYGATGMDYDGDVDRYDETRKIKAHSAYGQMGTCLPGGSAIQFPYTSILSFISYKSLENICMANVMEKVEVANSILIRDKSELKILKYRESLQYGINTEGFDTITVEEAKAMTIKDFESRKLIIELPKNDENESKPQSKILNLPENDKLYEWVQKSIDRGVYRNKYTMKETDDICKTLDKIFDKELIDEFPEGLSDVPFMSEVKTCPSIISSGIRWSYIHRAGFAIVTKVFADVLAEYLRGKKCLEIMAGKAVISKALQDRGIDIVATDNLSWHDKKIYNDAWTDVENIEAGDAIRKYKDVDVIIVSWMPLDVKGKRIARMIRKHNPNVEIISIEEDCTANESWYNRVDYTSLDEFREVASKYRSWYSVHDRPYLCQISKPWIQKKYDHDDNYIEALKNITSELKTLANEHDIPIITAIQSNKAIVADYKESISGGMYELAKTIAHFEEKETDFGGITNVNNNDER